MSKFWNLITHLHSLAGPVLMLLYPLYASVVAIESPSKVDDQQWLSYWIIYSFLTLAEMLLQPILEWIPIWYDVKLIFVGWLVLPYFNGAAFLYERFVREHIKRYVTSTTTTDQPKKHKKPKEQHPRKPNLKNDKSSSSSPNTRSKGKKKFVDFLTPKKGDHEVY